MNLKEAPDTVLLQGLKEGQREAFELLYFRYWEPLYHFAMKRLKDEGDAKDVVQDVFINLWQRGPALEITVSMESYLFSCVRYELLRKISVALKQEARLQHYREQVLPDFVATLDPLVQKELSLVIQKEIAALPSRQQEIYRLSEEEQLSVAAIAVRLGLSEQTVRNQLSTALKKLRGGLKEALILLLLFKL